jgi:hypothetical protein
MGIGYIIGPKLASINLAGGVIGVVDADSIAPLLPAVVREAEKVERLGLPFTTPLSVFGREWPEFQEARLSECSSNRNFRKRSVSSAQNRSASDLLWNPTTTSSANRTTIISPVASFRRHAKAHRSNA